MADTDKEEHGVRKYLPSAWVDEFIPEPQKDVNRFLHRMPDGTWMMMPAEDQEEEFWHLRLQPGQVVAFMATEWYGWFTIDIAEDRSVDDGGIPDKANHFCLAGDIDTLVHNLADLVENGDGSPLEPGSHDVTAYWWSDDETHFRFIIEDSGTGRFEPSAGAH